MGPGVMGMLERNQAETAAKGVILRSYWGEEFRPSPGEVCEWVTAMSDEELRAYLVAEALE